MKPYKSEKTFICAALGGQVKPKDEFDSNPTTDHLFKCGMLVSTATVEKQPQAEKTAPKKATGPKSKTYETKVKGDKPEKK